MKVVLALDTSSAGAAVLEAALRRPWPRNTYFEVISVAAPSLAWSTADAALDAQRLAQRVVANAIAQIHARRWDVAGAVYVGDPKNVILGRLRALGADFLLMGSGCGGFPSFGSLTTALLRYAPCSIELARAAPADNANGLRILLATDSLASSEHAAGSIAVRPWPSATEVRILSVPELILPANSPESVPPLIDSAFMESVHARAGHRSQEAVARARQILALPELAASESIVEGAERPKTAILDEARAWGAHLIVLASHGSGRSRFPIGTVAEAVAMHAGCSVEIIR